MDVFGLAFNYWHRKLVLMVSINLGQQIFGRGLVVTRDCHAIGMCGEIPTLRKSPHLGTRKTHLGVVATATVDFAKVYKFKLSDCQRHQMRGPGGAQ